MPRRSVRFPSSSSSRASHKLLSSFMSFLKRRQPPRPTLFPYTTLFRSYWSQVPNCYFTADGARQDEDGDRKSTRLNSSHLVISYAVFCLKKKGKIFKSENTENSMICKNRTSKFEINRNGQHIMMYTYY